MRSLLVRVSSDYGIETTVHAKGTGGARLNLTGAEFDHVALVMLTVRL